MSFAHPGFELGEQLGFGSEGRASKLIQRFEAVEESFFIREVEKVQRPDRQKTALRRRGTPAAFVHQDDLHLVLHREADGLVFTPAEADRIIEMFHLHHSQP